MTTQTDNNKETFDLLEVIKYNDSHGPLISHLINCNSLKARFDTDSFTLCF